MSHRDENDMVDSNWPLFEEDDDHEIDPDEARDLSWYDLKEIAAEQRRTELRDELHDIGEVFSPGWITKHQAE